MIKVSILHILQMLYLASGYMKAHKGQLMTPYDDVFHDRAIGRRLKPSKLSSDL